MSLDAPKSDAELLALLKRRQPGSHGVAPLIPRSASSSVVRKQEIGPVMLPGTILQLHQCDGRMIRLVLGLPPRTKKNGTTLGIKQTPAYRRYRDAIVAALAPLKLAQTIPLPDAEYNIAAVYYVDRRGERADKVGLDQGLYDALENAGVVTNDWQFRTADGTRIVFGDPTPRVELTITPLESPNA